MAFRKIGRISVNRDNWCEVLLTNKAQHKAKHKDDEWYIQNEWVGFWPQDVIFRVADRPENAWIANYVGNDLDRDQLIVILKRFLGVKWPSEEEIANKHGECFVRARNVWTDEISTAYEGSFAECINFIRKCYADINDVGSYTIRCVCPCCGGSKIVFDKD